MGIILGLLQIHVQISLAPSFPPFSCIQFELIGDGPTFCILRLCFGMDVSHGLCMRTASFKPHLIYQKKIGSTRATPLMEEVGDQKI